ncbi:hypothetical protein AB0E10_39940 [Streptomyces sp. NPDC048045]|uniref:hypothetical protein n=1 Tax=Streptomyces sp. NPDC048045 TaxID=3154710 RepID=UPI003420D484
MRCGTATDSRVFDYVRGRCDVCWYGHDYDKDLSERLMRILRELIPVDPHGYFEDLGSFTDGHHARLKQLHEHIGHKQAFHRSGRYVLARQPETLILLERAATAPDILHTALEDTVSTRDLSDLATAWEATA